MKKRVVYLDAIKIMAILFVVYNHVVNYIQVSSFLSKIIFAFLFDVCKVAVPLFIMASGALLLGKKDSYKAIYCKRIFRILIPLILVIILNLLIFNKGFSFSSIFDFVFTIIGDLNSKVMPYWSWYLFMLLGLYVMLPFLRKMIKNFNDKDFKIFIFIFCIIVSFLNYIPVLSAVFFKEMSHINQYFLSTLFSISIGYFVFGFYVNNINITKKVRNICFVVLMLSIIMGSIFLYYEMYIIGHDYNFLISWNTIIVTIPSMCFFILFKYYAFLFDRKKIKDFLPKIGDTVLGIYLFHPFLILPLFQSSFFKYIFGLDMIMGALILTFVICLILMVIIHLATKVSFIRKFL